MGQGSLPLGAFLNPSGLPLVVEGIVEDVLAFFDLLLPYVGILQHVVCLGILKLLKRSERIVESAIERSQVK